MNAKQAARLVSRQEAQVQIDRLNYMNKCASIDIQGYNLAIQHMIAGGSICDWCEDRNECQLEAKGKGCAEWWLKYPDPEEAQDPDEGSDADESERILPAGTDSRE